MDELVFDYLVDNFTLSKQWIGNRNHSLTLWLRNLDMPRNDKKRPEQAEWRTSRRNDGAWPELVPSDSFSFLSLDSKSKWYSCFPIKVATWHFILLFTIIAILAFQM